MKGSLNIIFGIGAGIINCIAWYALSRSFTYYEVAAIDKYRLLITVFLLIAGVFLAVFFQRRENNGLLEFKIGFKTGVLYALLLGFLLAIFNYLYYKYIAPDAIDFYVSEAKKQMILDKKLEPKDVVKFEEAIRNLFSSFKMFMTTVMMGVILSLIAAGILQKKPPALPFSEN
jgi:integrase